MVGRLPSGEGRWLPISVDSFQCRRLRWLKIIATRYHLILSIVAGSILLANSIDQSERDLDVGRHFNGLAIGPPEPTALSLQCRR